MATTPPAKKPAAKRAARRSLAEIDTSNLNPAEIAALAEQTAGAGCKKPADKSNKVSTKTTKKTQKAAKNAGGDNATVKSRQKPAKTADGKAMQAKGEPPKVGRPPKDTSPGSEADIILDKICERIAKGEPLRQICRDETMPAWTTVYAWLDANKQFAERFARARIMGEDALAQECLDIADNAANDWMERLDEDDKTIGWQLNGDHVQRSKLRIETRLKLLAKWNPKRYGDKVDVNHGGQEGNPVDVRTRVVLVPSKNTAQVETKPLKTDET